MTLIECPECQTQLDPNANDTRWHPPVDKKSRVDIGSIECPSCGKRFDFSKWKIITGKQSDLVKASRNQAE